MRRESLDLAVMIELDEAAIEERVAVRPAGVEVGKPGGRHHPRMLSGAARSCLSRPTRKATRKARRGGHSKYGTAFD